MEHGLPLKKDNDSDNEVMEKRLRINKNKAKSKYNDKDIKLPKKLIDKLFKKEE